MIKKYIRIDKNKNSKPFFYMNAIVNFLTPSFLFQRKLLLALDEAKKDKKLLERLNYYNKYKKTIDFHVSDDFKSITEFKKEKKKTYYFDLLRYLKYFDKNLKISYLFGDITHVPEVPTLLKSRPINGDNTNSILMKLNSVRHFIFVDDKLQYEEKLDKVVWRGKCYTPHRIEFIKIFYKHPRCDFGQTNTKGDLNVPWQKKKLSLSEQLKYKFILAIEGNDVASNLKWAMSSNSLVFMTKPKYETWFMEGLLKPDYHYVLLKDDYSDLDEKIEFYLTHTDKAKEIIANAHQHVEIFKNPKKELLMSLLVLDKYFKNTN